MRKPESVCAAIFSYSIPGVIIRCRNISPFTWICAVTNLIDRSKTFFFAEFVTEYQSSIETYTVNRAFFLNFTFSSSVLVTTWICFHNSLIQFLCDFSIWNLESREVHIFRSTICSILEFESSSRNFLHCKIFWYKTIRITAGRIFSLTSLCRFCRRRFCRRRLFIQWAVVTWNEPHRCGNSQYTNQCFCFFHFLPPLKTKLNNHIWTQRNLVLDSVIAVTIDFLSIIAGIDVMVPWATERENSRSSCPLQ